MNKKAIGIFDSGLGGLSALREIKNILPNEDIIYFGDTARVPYGTKTSEVIKSYAIQDARFLLSKNIKAMVIACGTASSHALEELKRLTDIPVIDVVKPASQSAVSITENGKIAILGTSSTIKSRSFETAMAEFAQGKALKFFSRACPLFVPLVENGYIGEDCELTRLACKEYLADIAECSPDVVILGCTHFPLIAPVIKTFFPSSVLIDTGKEAALALKKMLEEKRLLNDCGGKTDVYTSDEISSFEKTANIFLSSTKVNYIYEKVNIEKY